MTSLSQITRPLSWFAPFKARGTQASAAGLAKEVPAKEVLVKEEKATPALIEAITGVVRWKGNRLTLPRTLDASCYEEVIAAAQRMVASGEVEIVVDLGGLEHIDLSGLFALHCIALTLRGMTLPDPAHGWHAIRTAAEQNLAAGRCDHVQLINGSAPVTAKLQANQLDRCLLIVP